MDGNTVGIICAIIGGFVGLAGWLMGRDKKIGSDAEWRGSVNTKLDIIVVGIKGDVDTLKSTVDKHGEKITEIDSSTKQAHHRIDEIKAELSDKK
ncbi:MAG TPA: hypothetical protein VHO94_03995 [Oscillospiraceae bacterium]|nr:hypothetical protein [Oscillospiraceae bacterium]